jgi:hypothetical protein
MRGSGATFQQIASREGYRSRQSAMHAVRRHRDRENGTLAALADRRFDADEGYRIVQATLFAELAEARQRRDTAAVIAASKVVTDTIDKRVRLLGLAVPVAAQVDVRVQQSVTAVLDRATEELLQLLPTEPHQAVLEALDAEVIAG